MYLLSSEVGETVQSEADLDLRRLVLNFLCAFSLLCVDLGMKRIALGGSIKQISR
jgi:hypothetical protein